MPVRRGGTDDFMALDGVYLHHILLELEKKLVGGRVDKIHQPGRDEIILQIRTREEQCRLLISARPDTARIHLSKISPENPKQPPMLCMLLRKRLQSAKVLGLRQSGLERVLKIDFDSVNELGDHVTLTLAVEIMGKYSNVILVNEEGKIIDALKRVDAEMSSERMIFPGLIYRDPPAQDKLCILNCTAQQVLGKIKELPKEMYLNKALMAVLQGISPIVARELEHISGRGAEVIAKSMSTYQENRLINALDSLRDTVENGRGIPFTVLTDKPVDFSFLEPGQYGAAAELRREESFSALLDRYYAERDRLERMRVRSADILRLLATRTERLTRKLQNQQEELSQCGEKEEKRIWADLINASQAQIPKSASKVSLINYYDENLAQLEIPLDPALSTAQNAQKYYKEYRKSRTAQVKLKEQIDLGKEELAYLESVFYALTEAANEHDLAEIREELMSEGYIKTPKGKGKKPKKEPEAKPLEFVSPKGLKILVGRNNGQNDKLTLKTAAKNDLWFHTKNIPGSHTILVTQGAEPDEESIYYAACIAAGFSKAADSTQVPVDYTKARYVSKPQGSKPGMVIYVNQKTLYVKPEKMKP